MAFPLTTRKDFVSHVNTAMEPMLSFCETGVAVDLKRVNRGPIELDIRPLSQALRLKKNLLSLKTLDGKSVHEKMKTFSSLLECCLSIKDLEIGKEVHSFIVENEQEPTLELCNALVNMYCKCGSVADARSLFDRMNEKDVFTWTTMIAAYAILGPPGDALDLFWDMNRQNVQPDKVTYLGIIKACAKLKVLEHGKQIHASLKRSSVDQNVLLQSSIVDMYAKCGSIDRASQEFKKMPRRDVVAWNAMISGYAQNGCFEEALDHFSEMMKEGFKPDKITFACVLKACANLQMPKQGMWVHDFLLKQNLKEDIFVGSTLVDMYAKSGNVADAWSVFTSMPRKTVVTWNAMISGYAQTGYAEKSLELFWKMEAANITPTVVTYVNVSKACAVLGVLEQAKLVHRSFSGSTVTANLILNNAFVDMYAKCGDLKEAHQLFYGMRERDLVSWNALIVGFSSHGPAIEAIELYGEMQKEGLPLDRVTVLSVFKACTNLPSIQRGIQLHSCIQKSPLASDVYVGSALVDMYAKCCSVEEARKVFDEMPEKNEVTWNAMISGYVQVGCVDQAVILFQQMHQSSTKPVRVTFLSMIKACSNICDIEKGNLIHALIVFSGFESDTFIKNSLVDMYSKCGNVYNAQHIFNRLKEKSLVSWNAMISGFIQQQCTETAFQFLEDMAKTKIEPNEVTFLTAVRACASSNHLEYGMRVHSCIMQADYESFPYVGNSLVDMYSKCKRVDDARYIFNHLSKEDMVTWNVMIYGYASSGYDEDAFKLFHQMHSHGLQPDEVTLLSLLRASGGLGNLELGMEVHELISKNSLRSNVLGNALIDMYAKCGSFYDACDAFKKLAKREVVSWNALISGYIHHGHAAEALKLFQEMREDSLAPDRITFLNVLNACGALGCLDQAKQIHLDARNGGLEFDLYLNNTIVDMYAKCGDVEMAHKSFDKMQERDAISWNALMTGYAQHGQVQETIECFDKMQAEQKLDQVTYVTALSMCNYAGLVAEGCHYFDSLSNVHGIGHSQEHCTCMVDTLCRAGRIQEAAEFTYKMPLQPGPTVWMALLSGCRLGSSLLEAKNAAENIFELQPCHTAPYVVLSNICALPGDWISTNALT